MPRDCTVFPILTPKRNGSLYQIRRRRPTSADYRVARESDLSGNLQPVTNPCAGAAATLSQVGAPSCAIIMSIVAVDLFIIPSIGFKLLPGQASYVWDVSTVRLDLTFVPGSNGLHQK